MIANRYKIGFAFKQRSLITCNKGVQSAPIPPDVMHCLSLSGKEWSFFLLNFLAKK